MPGPDRLVYYLRGAPESFDGAPDAIEIPRVYETESDARAELSVVMTLSRMVHGDAIANSTSWYLQTADVASAPALGEEEVFHGYLLADTVYPLAGGWDELLDAFDWEPFVCEIERGRAHRARLPWRRDMLGQFSIETCRPTCDIDYSYFRFTPVSSELLVRPLNVYVTEPLF
ncbi:MAG: hypothetical protein QOD90_378 [Mycobacterium sp.]|jgi:hypothetical protein|nr:hypothetical protein [Mycobacterium sp.]